MRSSSIIKGLRGKRLLSQENVANMLDISRQTYNSLENNLMNVNLGLIFKLLLTLKVNKAEIDEFFDALTQDYMSYETRQDSE